MLVIKFPGVRDFMKKKKIFAKGKETARENFRCPTRNVDDPFRIDKFAFVSLWKSPR